jgi:hypothetical protein
LRNWRFFFGIHFAQPVTRAAGPHSFSDFSSFKLGERLSRPGPEGFASSCVVWTQKPNPPERSPCRPPFRGRAPSPMATDLPVVLPGRLCHGATPLSRRSPPSATAVLATNLKAPVVSISVFESEGLQNCHWSPSSLPFTLTELAMTLAAHRLCR